MGTIAHVYRNLGDHVGAGDIIAEANPSYDINFAKSRITFALRQDHGITDPAKDDFNIQTQADILSILGSITSILNRSSWQRLLPSRSLSAASAL
ncbi:MAG: hypothetical protein Q8P23_01085 [bacterium]|nr:hypothetical protein [bacterium]